MFLNELLSDAAPLLVSGIPPLEFLVEVSLPLRIHSYLKRIVAVGEVQALCSGEVWSREGRMSFLAAGPAL